MQRHGWLWDQLHCPQPLTPLAEDIWHDKMAGFSRGFIRIGSPARGLRIVANGYGFNRQELYDDEYVELRAAVAKKDTEERIDRVLELWRSEYQPEVQAVTRAINSFGDPALSFSDLVSKLDQLEAAMARLGELHVMFGVSGIAGARFIGFCKSEFGADGETIAAETMGGVPNKSVESGKALWDLSREVASRPEVERLLRTASPTEFLTSLESVAGGPDTRDLLTAFLAAYRNRNESFTEIVHPTWREDPRFVLFMLRSYLDVDESGSPAALHEKAAQLRVANG